MFLLDYCKKEITPELKVSTKPEDIPACLHVGALQDCYAGTNVRVQLQE